MNNILLMIYRIINKMSILNKNKEICTECDKDVYEGEWYKCEKCKMYMCESNCSYNHYQLCDISHYNPMRLKKCKNSMIKLGDIYVCGKYLECAKYYDLIIDHNRNIKYISDLEKKIKKLKEENIELSYRPIGYIEAQEEFKKLQQ